MTVAAGAVCKALLAELGVEVAGSVVDIGDVAAAKAERDTVGGVVEVRASGVPPGLGSYATKEDRLDARLAAALMGIQAVKGEEIVVRAAMKPLPTLMRPLRSVDLETGEPGEALVERSDTAAVEALSVVAEAAVAFELARAACEKFGGDSLADFRAAHRAYLERIPWHTR